MLVRDIMTQHVQVVDPDEALDHAARIMRELDIGSIPVCDRGRLVGLLTDRDIAVRAVAAGRDPKRTAVAEVMTRPVFCCAPEHAVESVALVMRARQIRRIPVIDQDEHVVGMVGLADIALEARNDRLLGAVVESVSTPHPGR